jgi:hypothetical protein
MRQMNWKQFLEKRHLYAEGMSIRLCDWAETLVRDVLLPQVHEKQYTLSVSPKDYVTCLLNTLYRSLQPRSYVCAHRRTFVWTPEQYEYFNEQFPPVLWKRIRDEFHLELLTDRVWSDLEYFVFSHIDFDKSHANTLMEDQYKGIEDLEDEEMPE